tara:strand:+ start:401 stop:679 length:279 start_codon:yes stop_codon:yes gene_type:complete
MITPPSNQGGVPPASPEPRSSRPAVPPAAVDRVSLPQQQHLQEALKKTPEIRPEVVERGRNLATDPAYPPLEIINRLASIITASQDPSLAED